ncbi:MAG: hypothetical protein K2K97_04150 [Muribaculaceae bacterium]|nr:hypothetical protein [Muribaculaceae bacterium]
MTIGFLAAISAQMGSAWLNSSRSKSHSKKMAELQRVYEEKAAIEGLKNARAEFAELCSFQREMEKQTHKDRLELIKNNHEQTLYQVAYERSLHKWPLLVPPYVIASAPLTYGDSIEQFIPLNCIFTTSTNLSFNRHVFPRIEEQIAVFCSKYWNISANKSIRFFQEAWKDTTHDIGSLHKDIYAHLKNVPTLLISPVLKNETILFRFYWWGLSLDPTDAHVDELNELNPELSIAIMSDTKFDGEISNLIVKECVPKLEAFISFFADLYYWNFYKCPPSLPMLINNSAIHLSNNELKDYKSQYTQLLEYSTSDTSLPTNNPKEIAEYILSVSNFVDTHKLNNCIVHYINNKRGSGHLNGYYLETLAILRDIRNISKTTLSEIDSAISYIHENEEIGYLPCVGRNDLLQSLINQKQYIPSAKYVSIYPLYKNCSAIYFLDEDFTIAIGPVGYQTYLATHPEFDIQECKLFSLFSCKLERLPNGISRDDHIGLSKGQIETLLSAQTQFANNLSSSYEKLKNEFWNSSLTLIDVSYDNIPSIIRRINPNFIPADSCLIVMGYSRALDNYTLCLTLIKDNEYVGDRFVCKSNSIDKTIRKKLNSKTVLKIQLL